MGEKWGKMGKKWVKNEITGVQVRKKKRKPKPRPSRKSMPVQVEKGGEGADGEGLE